MKTFKVWGGNTHQRNKQVRTIVCAKTKKRALELLKDYLISSNYFNNYWCETGNKTELEIANNEEGVWFNLQQKTYIRIK